MGLDLQICKNKRKAVLSLTHLKSLKICGERCDPIAWNKTKRIDLQSDVRNCEGRFPQSRNLPAQFTAMYSFLLFAEEMKSTEFFGAQNAPVTNTNTSLAELQGYILECTQGNLIFQQMTNSANSKLN